MNIPIFCFNILALLFLLMCCPAKTYTNLTTDQFALVDFNAHITSDPYHIIKANWSNSISVCSWIGITCGLRNNRVTVLNVTDMGLSGSISPQLGNLSFLVSLDLAYNHFSGALPLQLSLLRRLKHLNLRNNSFSGSIPNHLSNLPNLQFLDLSFNSLNGEIPGELGRLHSLQSVNMSGNHLSGHIPSSLFNISTLKIIALTLNELNGSLPNDLCKNLPSIQGIYLALNKLSGYIPSNLSQCCHLKVLGLSYNLFNGQIPTSIGELKALHTLALGGNNLNGIIPQDIGNLQNLMELGLERNQISGGLPTNIFNISSLQTLALQNNKLEGNLPREISNFTTLEVLRVSYNYLTGDLPRGFMSQVQTLGFAFNRFTGIIPPELFNISTLLTLDLTGNALPGALPINMCYPNSLQLQNLYLGENNITGVIPDYFSNCSGLKILDLSYNEFAGFLPPHIIRSLPLLQYLQLASNNLRIEMPSFIDSLTSCTSLIRFGVGDNPAYGIIPSSVGNLSSSLQEIFAYACNIKATIPPQIGNLSNLITLCLFENELSGNIPPNVRHLVKLQALYLHNNNLKGPIPEGMCDLNSLTLLSLGLNQLSEPIPECLGDVTSLRNIFLNSNKLSSNIPSSLWHLKDLLSLDLSENDFTGSIPLEIGSLISVVYLNLSVNQLSESIPSTIGNLQNLANLSLAHNRLEGSIPTSLGSMISLESLDLSHNNLSGFIPKSLELLQHLKYLNVSSNELSGEIPTGGPFKNFTMESFKSNKALCGAPGFNVPPCPPPVSRKKRVGFALFIVAGVVVVFAIVCLAIIFTRCRAKQNRAGGVDGLASVVRERISYYEILQATDRFGESNLLGLGSFGSVYKGVLRDGKIVAVKVFHLQPEAALRSFDVECEILRNIRHRHLIKVVSSCSNLDFRALVLEYMPKGSLDQWLYSHNYCLDVMQRLNIMIDVASALEYLHHGYSTPIVHCDLKPSNVLLDEEMIGHVGDFGIAKLFANEESNVITNTLATLGYIAPEYGLEGLVSTKCDVYSYGIMLMETFTRKRPSDDMFVGDLSLRSWVESSFPESSDEVMDANLLNVEERQLEKKIRCVSSVLEVGLKCSAESPRDRMNMKEALAELNKIKHILCH